MPRILLFKRFPRICLFAVIGAVIFLSFQFFSLKMLNSSNKRMSDEQMLSHDNDEVEVNFQEVDVKIPAHNRNFPDLPKGVHADDAEFYQSVKNNKFRCLHSKELIPFSQVNDDFCDCQDSTDEPGTSACPHARFYCKTQMPDRDAQSFPSSRVNDGVCDCCDGSDEWANQAPPKFIQVKGKNIMSQAPCENKCAQVIKVNRENENIRQMGKRLRPTYLAAAKHVQNKEKYGPDGVFYKLSQHCYTHKSSEYEYTVCPFHSVKQSKYSINPTMLGKISKWKQKSHGRYILEMAGGDSTMCPGGQMRSSVILFLCGINDRVVSVQEDEKCTYVIKFATAAAC